MRFAAALATLVLLTACSSTEKRSDIEVGPRLSDIEYTSLLNKHTKHDQVYEGFYNTLEVRATFLNSDVQAAILQRSAETMQWDAKAAQAEREKMFQQNSNSTKFFVSFFVPTKRLNKLDKPDSIWKIYLEANGEKYEGKASKRREPLEALKSMYPAHTRWGTPYEITFSVPLSAIEGSEAKLTFASSVAKTTLTFSPIQK